MHLYNRLRVLVYLPCLALILLSTSVSAQKCVDSRLPFPHGRKGNRVASCKDIGGKIQDKACGNVNFASHCPKTCGACREFKCADSKRNFIRKGVIRTCDWLDGLSPKRKKARCSSRRIKRTCRSTCEYCGQKKDFVDFDEVEVEETIDYFLNEKTGLYFGNTMAVNSKFAKEMFPELPWDEMTTTKPNLGATNRTDYAVYMSCFEGTFDLKSMTLMPVYVNDESEYYYDGGGYYGDYYYGNGTYYGEMEEKYGNKNVDPSAIISAYDKNFNLTDEVVVEFEEVGEVKNVEFPPGSFEEIRYIVLSGYYARFAMYAFDTLDGEIKSPCNGDNMDKAMDIMNEKLGPST